jgi:DNA-directed RNA polymerase II subunit RPB3
MEQKQELVDICPDRILEIDEVTGSIKAVEDYWDIATYTEDIKMHQDSLKRRKEDDDFVRIEHSTDKFIFSVESTGCMDADEIVMSALRVLKDRLNYLAQEVENLKDNA